ncbi:MAG: GNAT family N-acetyltransferase [Clostridiaceae bacterium]|jgi:ribosomal protein S18 acetylase RimI-like enzyme|nr:GNAT family N-acetyltransferase [Clostridiaceae bacterium]
MKDILIKRAELDDAQAIMQVTKEAFEWYAKASGAKETDAQNEDCDTVKYDIQNKYVYCAYLNGILIGSLRVEINDTEQSAYLSRFGVLTEYRNLGVGKRLIFAVDSKMEQLGVEKLYLHTSTNISSLMTFYKNAGFLVHSVSKERGYPRALLVKRYKIED